MNRSDAELGRAGGDRTLILNEGLPSSSVSTSASSQDKPSGAPNAFANASFAANRAAFDAIGRSAWRW